MKSPETERRDELRAELNRTLMLDAAEAAFAERGYEGASLRDIAARAGFSSAATYLYFANKQDLYDQVLIRRADSLLAAMHQSADPAATPMARLHAMADAAVEFYRSWPNYARLLAMVQATMGGSPMSQWEEHPNEEIRTGYRRAMDVQAGIIAEGQRNGSLHAGDAQALAHLYSVLVNTFLSVGSETPGEPGLSRTELHAILDRVFAI